MALIKREFMPESGNVDTYVVVNLILHFPGIENIYLWLHN